VSSLWTPEGEHRVGESVANTDEVDRRPPLEEQEEAPPDEADVEALREELLTAPVEDIVANHCFGLFQIAALHLDARPPSLDKARLAIDALGGIVDTVGDRLGPHADTLKGALSSIRLAFVEISKPRDGEGPATPASGDAAAT
jgi:hypothetical protein